MTIVHHIDLQQLDSVHLPVASALALSIGNFDGVHLAHQTILTALKEEAQAYGYQSAVMIFEPQPQEFFNPTLAPARLTTWQEKYAKFKRLNIDLILVIKFDQALANLSALAFIDFLHRLNVKLLAVGDDFRFGQGRKGDTALLMASGIVVRHFKSILHGQHRISSTAIRALLADGELAKAKVLLGEDYQITGQVIHGDKLGRTLNFPTANIALERKKPALQGVFAVAVEHSTGFDPSCGGLPINPQKLDGQQSNNSDPNPKTPADKALFGCANIGTRPSVNGTDYRLEVYLPNFSGDLYGQTLSVRFLHFLHGERHYESLDDLQIGIKNDVQALLAWAGQQGFFDC